MRRPFLDGGDDHFENSSSAFGMRNHERNEEFHDRQGSNRGSEMRQPYSQSRPTFSQMAQARLDGINQELKSAGFKELGPLCYCESNSVDSIFEVIKSLITEFNKCYKKSRETFQNFVDQRNMVMRQEKDIEQLKDVRAQLTRDKEFLNEKIKGILREQKEKEDKNVKEKDVFAKERKSWSQKEDAFRLTIKNYEDKISNYEKRINKLQKGDKTEYKNVLEVNVGFPRNEKVLLGKDYAQMVAKQTVEAQKAFLEEENNELKHFIKEIFDKTQRIYQKIDHEMGPTTYREEIVEIPINFTKSRGFPDILRNYLYTIEKKVSEVRIITNNMSQNSFSNCNEEDLNRQINELKGLYSTWEQINNERKKLVPNMIELLKNEKDIRTIDYADPRDEEYHLTENNMELLRCIEQKKNYCVRELTNFGEIFSRLGTFKMLDLKEQ